LAKLRSFVDLNMAIPRKGERNMIKHVVLACTAAVLYSTSCVAASRDGVSTTIDKKITFAIPHKGKKFPVIYSNIATKYPKGPYYPYYGLTVAGPTSQIGLVETAVAFTPASNATVSEIEAAVGFIEGVNGAVLSIYSDAGGLPGSSLGDFKVSGLPTFGDCCEIATTTATKHLALAAGTQYWLVISTDTKESTTWDAVSSQTTDQLDPVLQAGNEGSGWVSYSSAFAPAVAILGK
jgi:hypothetical protein